MQLTVAMVKSPSEASHRPVEYLSAGKGARWRVVTGALPLSQGSGPSDPDAPPWLTVCDGDLIRIPLIPYQGPRKPAFALAFAVQVGAIVGAYAGGVRRLHLVVGSELEDLLPDGRDAARFWLGVAVEG